MIAFLAGTLARKAPDHLLLEVSGIGYKLMASTRTITSLGAVGEPALLQTHLHVRENEVSLYGFLDDEEKRAFLALIEVSGIGPKVALAVLSSLTPHMLAAALSAEDVGLLSSVVGIGKKTAQRIIIDLKGKLGSALPAAGTAAAASGDETGSAAAPAAANFADAQSALFSMGFSAAEIAEAFVGVDAESSAEDILRHALHRLSGRPA
ncbi:MAG: Holliday junction branch migration protein RuvA [Actinomycetes bacterium]|jgi:Holliday junction DNA helicase RuvA|nr:Holliday junction branch migration protein RuvA [Actinomycetes bacterium]